MVQTDVTAPDGTTGDVTRYVDTTTGQFTMDMAFLDSIPRELRWVQTDPPMVQGRGTPLETYLTMRQMRIMEGRTGNSAMFGGPRNVHMSTVINVRSTVELAQATRAGANPNDAALTTNSVQYASNSIIQSGGRISSATVSGGSMTRAGNLRVSAEEFARCNLADGDVAGYLARYGLTPNDQVLYGFDIDLAMEPAGQAPQTQPQRPGALTPTIPRRDDPDGGQ